jgi:hypothetical protein
LSQQDDLLKEIEAHGQKAEKRFTEERFADVGNACCNGYTFASYR